MTVTHGNRGTKFMKIATVTLNPAIDQTVRVDSFRPNTVNRALAISFDASGKGVNVASFLADYGHDTAVTGYLGQENADIFEQFFASKGIDDCFVRIPGNTRINVKVVDEVNQQTTDINMPGETPPQEAMNTLLQTIEQLTNSCDWFVLSGSLPPHVPATIYATIITQLKQQKKQIILDTSGEALREGIQAGQILGLSLADCRRLATAFAVGAIAHLSYNLPPRDTLMQYFHQVSIRNY